MQSVSDETPSAVKKNRELKFEEFFGATIADAEANARVSVGDKLLGLDTVRDVQDKSSTAQGRDADDTLRTVSGRVPKEAFDAQPAEIIQEGQSGTVDVNEYVEFEARKAWRHKTPRGAQLDAIECISPPKNGVLGMGKKQGRWKVNWSAPFIAEVKYKMPAIVMARYFG